MLNIDVINGTLGLSRHFAARRRKALYGLHIQHQARILRSDFRWTENGRTSPPSFAPDFCGFVDAGLRNHAYESHNWRGSHHLG